MLLICILYFFVVSTPKSLADFVKGKGINCLHNCNPIDVEIAVKLVKNCPTCGKTTPITLDDTNVPCLKEKPPCKAITMSEAYDFEINPNILPDDKEITVFFNEIASGNKYEITLSTAKCKSKIICMDNCNYFFDKDLIFKATTVDPKCVGNKVDWTVEPKGKNGIVTTYGILKILGKSYKSGDPVTISSIMDGRKVKELSIRYVKSCEIIWPISEGSHNAKLVCNYDKDQDVYAYLKNIDSPGPSIELYNGPNIEQKFYIKPFIKWKAYVQVGGKTFDLGKIFIVEDVNFNIFDYIYGHERYEMENLLKDNNFYQVYRFNLLFFKELEYITDEKVKISLLRHFAKSFEIIGHLVKPKEMADLFWMFLKQYLDDPIALNLFAESVLIVTKVMLKKKVSFKDMETRNRIANITSHLKKNIDSIIYPNITKISIDDDYLSYDDMEYKNVAILKESRLSTLSFVKIVEALGGLNNILPWDDESEIILDTFRSNTFKLAGGYAFTHFIAGTTSKIVIAQNLSDELRQYSDLFLHVAHIYQNSFWWDSKARDICTDVLMVNLISNGTYITKTEHNLDLYFRVNESRAAYVVGKLSMNESDWRVYQFQTKNNSRIIATIFAGNEKLYTHVTEHYPTYEASRELGRIVPPESNRTFQISSTHPLVYVSIIRRRGTNINYEISVISIQCVTWNMTTWDWTDDGCTFGPDSSPALAHCICNHLSLFGASYFVAPNKIQFFEGVTFTSGLKESRIVIITILGIVIIYLCALGWAAYRDKVLQKRRVCFFPDTIPGDKHIYLIGVLTGLLKGAATTAHISIQLFGSASNSRRHIIPFNSFYGDEDWYVMATPKPLGHIFAVRVFHDSFGSSPNWFCERIIVRDISKRKQFTFITQAWLSLVKGDGLTDRIFKLPEGSYLRKGSVLFSIHARHELRDSHLLFSVFTRPPDSTFTCKERVTLAFTVLFMTLTTSAMFYEPGAFDPEGTFFLSYREVVVVLESLAITAPLSVILSFLFRKSRPL